MSSIKASLATVAFMLVITAYMMSVSMNLNEYHQFGYMGDALMEPVTKQGLDESAADCEKKYTVAGGKAWCRSLGESVYKMQQAPGGMARIDALGELNDTYEKNFYQVFIPYPLMKEKWDSLNETRYDMMTLVYEFVREGEDRGILEVGEARFPNLAELQKTQRDVRMREIWRDGVVAFFVAFVFYVVMMFLWALLSVVGKNGLVRDAQKTLASDKFSNRKRERASAYLDAVLEAPSRRKAFQSLLALAPQMECSIVNGIAGALVAGMLIVVAA